MTAITTQEAGIANSLGITRRRPSCLRITTLIIGFAIICVICIQWHFAIVHTRQNAINNTPHDRFLSSFVTPQQAASGGLPPIPDVVKQKQTSTIAKESIPTRRKRSKDEYITSPICGGCTRSYFDARPCYTLMQRDASKSKEMSMLDAAKKLGKESTNCAVCDPLNCWKHYFNNNTENYPPDDNNNHHQSKYWRFDTSYPEYINPTTLSLTSIPTEQRIPPSRFDDIGNFFQEKYTYAKANNESINYLVEYNPGLVQIPAQMKANLPEEATYLVSLRVTPANNCFSPKVYEDLPKNVWAAVYHTSTNHLGLTLLDSNYQPLPGYEAVIELDVPLDLKRDMVSKRSGEHVEAVSPTFMDYRLFVLNDEIYLHINADTVIISRLSLKAKGIGGTDNDDVGTCFEVAKEAGPLGSWEKPCRLNNLYGGDNLQVTLMRQFNTIWSGGINGKNYALFGIPNTKNPNAPDSIYAELDIFPHHLQQILPDEYDRLEKREVFGRIWKNGTNKSRKFKIDRVNMRQVKEVGNITESDDVPLPSFPSIDAHPDWFPGQDEPFKRAAHGGACCVSFSADEMNNHHDGPMLVGLGHTKVTWKPWYNKESTPQERKDRLPHTHYVSLFYAFEPYPPFQIRARSGYFCLGHVPLSPSNSNELPPTEGGIFNPHSILTRNRQLQQNYTTFDCPQMSFISSFIEKAGDSSSTVIGYGLNDCTGRLVEVKKEEIVRLLYPDPMDMIFE